MKAFLRHRFSALCLLILAVLGCTLLGCAQGQPDAARGSLVLSLGSEPLGARTIVPSVAMEIASYDIEGTGPDGETFGGSGLIGASSQWDDLAAGAWTVTANAWNADAILIATDTQLAAVEAGQTTQVVLTVAPVSGPGSLELAVTWPAAVREPGLTARLTAEDGTSVGLDAAVAGEGATCAVGDLASGYYYLAVQLKDGARLVWGRTEAVRILAGHTTQVAFPVEASDLNGSPHGSVSLRVESDLRAPFPIVLGGIVTPLPLHTDMTVSASADPASDSWQWFLDGEALPEACQSSVTLGSGLAPGTYWLDVLARRRGVLSSAHGRFEVSDLPPARAPQVGEVIFNEMMIDPAGVADTSGEWLEVCNVAAARLDIQGLVLRTATQYASIQGAGPVVEPGSYLVLCRNGDPAANGQVTASGTYGGISLPNSGGSLTLAGFGSNGMDGVAIDTVQWSSATTGRSLALKTSARNATDNDVSANWYWSTRPYSASDMGTPGGVNEQ